MTIFFEFLSMLINLDEPDLDLIFHQNLTLYQSVWVLKEILIVNNNLQCNHVYRRFNWFKKTHMII